MENTSISEFERNKPVITMSKIDDLIKRIEHEQIKTENLYRDRIKSLNDILVCLFSLRSSFKKGE
jgi:hypothetical protein